MYSTLTHPIFWQGFAACGLLAIVAGIALIAVISRSGEDDPRPEHFGGRAWPGSTPTNSYGPGPHPRTRRSDLRGGPR